MKKCCEKWRMGAYYFPTGDTLKVIRDLLYCPECSSSLSQEEWCKGHWEGPKIVNGICVTCNKPIRPKEKKRIEPIHWTQDEIDGAFCPKIRKSDLATIIICQIRNQLNDLISAYNKKSEK